MSPRKKGKESPPKSVETDAVDAADDDLVEGLEIVSTTMPGEVPAEPDAVGADEDAVSASEASEQPPPEIVNPEIAPEPAAQPDPEAGVQDDHITLDERVHVAPATDVGDETHIDGNLAPASEAAPVAPEMVIDDGVKPESGPQAEPQDDAPRLAELIAKSGRAGAVTVPPERAESVQLAIAEWLGHALDATPEIVDGRGLPEGLVTEAVNALGKDVAPLGRLILVSAAQHDVPLAMPLHSFEETLRDAAFRRMGTTIELLLERQILVGEISARPANPTAAEHLLALEEVVLKLDTPNRALSELGRLEESLSRVTAQPDLLLDEERIDALVARAQEMGAALGDVAGGGLTGPLEVALELGSFWTAAFGGVYRLAARPNILVMAGSRGKGSETDVLRLTEPGLIDRLHASNFLTYDTSLLEQRTRELEEWTLAAAGVDPGPMDDALRRRTVAGRARLMPRTWHEMIVVRRAVQSGPSGARIIHSLSAETKVKLSRPLKDLPVITRLLAELDAVDVPRQFAAAPDRFARDYAAAAPMVRRHMARAVLGAVAGAAPMTPPPAPEPPEPEEDDEEILFL